jgi:hypothetical protein
MNPLNFTGFFNPERPYTQPFVNPSSMMTPEMFTGRPKYPDLNASNSIPKDSGQLPLIKEEEHDRNLKTQAYFKQYYHHLAQQKLYYQTQCKKWMLMWNSAFQSAQNNPSLFDNKPFGYPNVPMYMETPMEVTSRIAGSMMSSQVKCNNGIPVGFKSPLADKLRMSSMNSLISTDSSNSDKIRTKNSGFSNFQEPLETKLKVEPLTSKKSKIYPTRSKKNVVRLMDEKDLLAAKKKKMKKNNKMIEVKTEEGFVKVEAIEEEEEQQPCKEEDTGNVVYAAKSKLFALSKLSKDIIKKEKKEVRPKKIKSRMKNGYVSRSGSKAPQKNFIYDFANGLLKAVIKRIDIKKEKLLLRQVCKDEDEIHHWKRELQKRNKSIRSLKQMNKFIWADLPKYCSGNNEQHIKKTQFIRKYSMKFLDKEGENWIYNSAVKHKEEYVKIRLIVLEQLQQNLEIVALKRSAEATSPMLSLHSQT